MVKSALAGEYRSAFKGSGLEFDEVRAYQYGDDVRNIDWNVTAKTGHPYIKVFREERELNVFVIFDISASEEFGAEGRQKLNVGAELAAVFGFCAQNNNDRFGLITSTDQVEFYSKPIKGRKRVLGIVSKLLAYQAKHKGTNLRTALDFFRGVQRKHAVVFIISDFLDTNYEGALKLLAPQHQINLVRLYHPHEALTANLGIIPVQDAETGVTRWVVSSLPGYRQGVADQFTEVHKKLEGLQRKYGFGYLNIDITQDYLPVLEAFFLNRSAGRKR